MILQPCLKGLEATASDALFSPCRRYRFALMRRWADGDWFGEVEGGILNVIGCNASTADELVNDPTVERCERRARKLGFGALVITNVFGWRSTNPKILRKVADPVGDGNDAAILEWARRAKMVLCAWGLNARLHHRSEKVRALLARDKIATHCLRLCACGEAEHPLYISYSVQPKPYSLNGA
jgi:hypothetical protein